MPIAIVEGVKLFMYANDHPPPHFHALFAEHRAVIEIESLVVTKGELPRRKLKAVLKWAAPRRTKACDLTQACRPVGRIA